jgi:hypothetical protein
MKIRPGSNYNAEVLVTRKNSGVENRSLAAWSPSGDWILMTGRDGLYLITPDFDFTRERKLLAGTFGAAGFSKDGRQVLGTYRNTSGKGSEWQLLSFDVATGLERKLADIDLPVTTDDLRGFSLHPDGKRYATSIAKWPFDIWMLEGFDEN